MNIISILLLFLAVLGCSSEETPSAPTTTNGKLSLNVTINKEVTEVANARTLEDDVTVDILDSNGEVAVSYASISAIPEEIELATGVYTSVAKSTSASLTGFDTPQYGGISESYSITTDALTAEKLDCTLQNTKVTVAYSDVIKNQYTTYSTNVTSDFGELTFEKDVTRAGYFRATGSLTVVATIGDNGQTVESVISDIQPTTLYKVTITIEEGTGKVVISVDESVLDGGNKDIVITPVEGEARPEYNTSIGFFTKNGKLYDPNGMEFVARGVNNAHFWFDNGGRDLALNALSAISANSSNMVRLVWQTDYNASNWENEEETVRLRKMINTCIANGMVPMIEMHDATGGENKEQIDAIVAYYTRPDILSVMKEFESILLINIANEWSGKNAVYRDTYTEAVTNLRSAGLMHTLVIDASGWGQDIQHVFDYGQNIIDSDPLKNILFSVHMYQSFRTEQSITAALEKAVELKLPLVVGEFGFKHGDPEIDIPFEHILTECERLEIGWLAWSWKGNSGGVEYLDLVEEWDGSKVTQWGTDIITGPFGLQNTAKKVSVLK
ncbi:DUF4493 domain-containing protein [Flammeovirga kamogawensis]|uniref:DUF4493 domain-containing protein n=1 Tax=Flammeovirga kamogawensis TaxID=373891 RepID=A0ABX8H5D4_9BACT|nr:DUF4493 domain-containing protein [Flammeovirga kamogawensis]MBB6461729.1 hypothetical protein [Flammeovirga kamogawensis]QWG10647.1 DUF4493 domain-containing protein [Flammeovirga kamogawensis]